MKNFDILQDSTNVLKFWKNLIESRLDGEEKENDLSELKETVKDFCFLASEAATSFEALEETRRSLQDDETKVDIDKLFQEKLSQKTKQLDETNYQQHQIWKEVMLNEVDENQAEVIEVNQPGTSAQNNTVYEEINDSMYYSETFLPPIDPLMKTLIKEPYKSTTCGHVYEHKLIMDYIKNRKGKAKCPYIGCNNKLITMAGLVHDEEMKRKIVEYTERQSQTSEDS